MFAVHGKPIRPGQKMLLSCCINNRLDVMEMLILNTQTQTVEL